MHTGLPMRINFANSGGCTIDSCGSGRVELGGSGGGSGGRCGGGRCGGGRCGGASGGGGGGDGGHAGHVRWVSTSSVSSAGSITLLAGQDYADGCNKAKHTSSGHIMWEQARTEANIKGAASKSAEVSGFRLVSIELLCLASIIALEAIAGWVVGPMQAH
jgi:hypothetical protein